MRTTGITFCVKTLAVAILTILTQSLYAEVRYNVIDLGMGTAWAVNNKGQVVGDSYGATLFDTSGGGNNTHLGGVTAYSINDNGQIVGYGEVGIPAAHHAMLFDSTGQGNNIDLGAFGADPSYAKSINNLGQIVGDASGPVIFDATGQGNNINLTGGAQGGACSINDFGKMVGMAGQAFLYDSTILQQPYARDFVYLGEGIARSINENGQIVGYAAGKATLFNPTGLGINIALGTSGSDALWINNHGQIVGISGGNATLFDPTGFGMNINLNTVIDPASGWTLQEAKCINDNGWIVGLGTSPAGYGHAFLLTPIPEPATLLLLGLGGLLLRRK